METQQILGNRYELRRRIGVGGMAVVFLAHDLRLDRDVAVKVLDLAGSTDATFVERFRREARAAAGINHVGVVSVYDWGEAGEDERTGQPLYYLVMEYVPGPNLKEKIERDGPLTEDDALRLAAQIAAALEAAHAKGLIHRDIKSHNVLLDSAGNAKVADFGIAYLEGLTHLTQTNAVSGTAHYISPEQAQGKRVDARTDIYSLGVVLYEMLAGRVPFEGESLIDVAIHHVQDQPIPVSRLRPGISPATEAIVARALTKDPSQRFQSAAEFRVALDRSRVALEDQTIRAQLAPAAEIVSEPVPVGRTVIAGAPARPRKTVKLGTGIPGRRPRVRQEERGPRWWLLAVPLLLLALVGGALAVRSLSHGGNTSAPPGKVPSTATPTSRATAVGRPKHVTAPVVLKPRRMPTATPVPVAHVTPPSPTQPPTVPSTRVPPTASPTAPSGPAVVPTDPVTQPTSVETSIASASPGGGSPDGAVTSFYSLVSRHQYQAAAGLWSSTMKANYPPSSNIYGRFDQTQQMDVRITGVTQHGNTATVGVALLERLTDGSVKGYAGSWSLVRGPSGWLLDSVNLTPARAASGAEADSGVPGQGQQNGNEGNG